MKKKIILVIIIVVAIILLFPIPMHLKDGGSIEFKAVLYTITKYHKLASIEEDGYIDGIGIEILGMEIYNSIKEKNNTVADEPSSVTENKLSENSVNEEKSSFVGTILEETTTYMIVEPNEDEEERKSSDKIRINYGVDHIDYLYGIGKKVAIYYTGTIMESYPAQINTNEISIDGYSDFEISTKESDNIKKTRILNNQDLWKNASDYDLYYYGLDEVKVNVDNKTMSLEEALRSGKITIDGIIKKANADIPDAISYDDGGSMEYKYDTYTIIKCHSLDGNRDVYIGIPEMTLNSINK